MGLKRARMGGAPSAFSGIAHLRNPGVERRKEKISAMQFRFTGFTEDKGFRVFAFDAVGEDRTRTTFTVRADLGLIGRHGIRVQQLPLLCMALLEEGREGQEECSLTFTEERMRLHADTCAPERDAAGKKKSKQNLPTKPILHGSESSAPLVPVRRRRGEGKTDSTKGAFVESATAGARIVNLWRDWARKGKLREEAIAQNSALSRKRILACSGESEHFLETGMQIEPRWESFHRKRFRGGFDWTRIRVLPQGWLRRNSLDEGDSGRNQLE